MICAVASLELGIHSNGLRLLPSTNTTCSPGLLFFPSIYTTPPLGLQFTQSNFYLSKGTNYAIHYFCFWKFMSFQSFRIFLFCQYFVKQRKKTFSKENKATFGKYIFHAPLFIHASHINQWVSFNYQNR